MRHAVLAIAITLTSFWAAGAFAVGDSQAGTTTKGKRAGTEQAVSCKQNVKRIGFTDQIQGGQPFELWKCEDQWHLSNLGNTQVYVNDKDKPCLKNSTTGEEKCCPEAQQDPKTKTQAPKDAGMATRMSCQPPRGSKSKKSEDKTDLVIEPAGENGNRSATTYRVTPNSVPDEGDTKAKPKTKKGIRICVDAPEKAGPANKKTGCINIQQEKASTGGTAGGKTGKGGPGNSCTQDSTKDGSYCQLAENILGHDYYLDKETKGAVMDEPSKPDGSTGERQAVESSGTGRRETSAGGAGGPG